MPDGQTTGIERLNKCSDPSGRREVPWLCVWTKPNEEGRAARELRQQGYPVYLPFHVIRLANRTKRIVPLFSRYLFIQPVNGEWASIRSTRYVSDILRNPAGVPYIVPTPVLVELWDRSTEEDLVIPEPRAKFVPGQSARALDGPFTSFVGVCELDEGSRVRMLMSIFGRTTPVWFAHDALEAA